MVKAELQLACKVAEKALKGQSKNRQLRESKFDEYQIEVEARVAGREGVKRGIQDGRAKVKCRREREQLEESLHMLTQPSNPAALIYSRTKDLWELGGRGRGEMERFKVYQADHVVMTEEQGDRGYRRK